MTGTTEPPIEGKEFCYDLDGLSFTITAFERDGKIYAKVLVTEGKMDVNALYWGDDEMAGKSASLNGPLNMNGAGSDVQWDGAVKISDPGLGKAGAAKISYLQAGTSQDVAIWEIPGVQSLDDLDFLGVRATSTTTPEGSIKAISQCDDHDGHEDGGDDAVTHAAPAMDVAPMLGGGDEEPPPPPEEEDHFAEWPQDISNVVFYFEVNGKPYNVKIDEFDEGAPRDFDSLYEAARAFIAEESDVVDAETRLLGVSIKGGTQPTEFFAIDDDPDDVDVAPGKLTNTGRGNAETFTYNDLARFAEDWDENAPYQDEEEDAREVDLVH